MTTASRQCGAMTIASAVPVGRWRLCLWAFALALMVVVAPASQAGDSHASGGWLTRMVEATRTLTYDGTFVFRSGQDTESMRIIHRADSLGERERLVSLDGVAREVIRNGDYVICILPDNATVLVGQRWLLRGFQSSALFGAAVLPDYYEVKFEAVDRVAGRKADRIRVHPIDRLRYGYRLWLDKETGLLLRSLLLDPDQRAIEEIVYTRLELPDSVPDKLLEPSVSGRGFKRFERTDTPRAPSSPPTGVSWEVTWAPDGFDRVDHVVTVAGDAPPIEHMVYSDGLASYSVFIERLRGTSAPMEGHSRVGAVSAFGKMVEGHQVTVVGEVPRETVERVGRSVGM